METVLTESGPRLKSDLAYENKTGQKVPAGKHYVNGEMKTAESLHKEYLATRGRGRPPKALPLSAVRQYRKDFFRGAITQKQIATDLGWSIPAVRRMLNGDTYPHA